MPVGDAVGPVVPIYEPSDDTIRQLVGRSVADPRRGRVDDRALERHDNQFWRTAFRFGGAYVIQHGMSEIFVVAGGLCKRERKELPEIISTTRRELQGGIRGSVHLDHSLDRGDMRPRRHGADATDRNPARGCLHGRRVARSQRTGIRYGAQEHGTGGQGSARFVFRAGDRRDCRHISEANLATARDYPAKSRRIRGGAAQTMVPPVRRTAPSNSRRHAPPFLSSTPLRSTPDTRYVTRRLRCGS